MSQRGGRPIDFQAWAQNQIVKRAVAALEALSLIHISEPTRPY